MLIGCGEQSKPSASARVQREPAAAEPTPDDPPSPEPPTAQCEPGDLADFPCAHEVLCSSPPRDETVDIERLLCVAQQLPPPRSGPTRLGEVLAALPVSFRKNFTAKHGLALDGPRGHAFEDIEKIVGPSIAATGQSATPDFPRVLMWDEATGFTISFNGGAAGQTGGDRLDLMRYDRDADAFELWALDLPLSRPLQPYQPHTPSDDCSFCHGPHGRPIWPMYPDWPGFYGSDNDELTTDEAPQLMEREHWAHFRRCIAAPGPAGTGSDCSAEAGDGRDRFSTLFADAMASDLRERWPTTEREQIGRYVEDKPHAVVAASRATAWTNEDATADWLGLRTHPTFPYRPDHAHEAAEPSRAFFHRPNLRIGVLYNRLLARAVARRLRDDPVFDAHAPLVVASIMDCPWPEDTRSTRRAAQAALLEAGKERLAGVSSAKADGTANLPYPIVLATLGLKVRDVDMRFSYPNPRFDRAEDLSAPWAAAETPMDVGYIAYAAKDMYGFSESDAYFNSYFDGSATFNELFVALVLARFAGEDAALADVLELHTLQRKYEKLTPRWALDEVFFRSVDSLGAWFPLPYPRHLRELHDREPYAKREGGRGVFSDPYLEVCAHLRRRVEAGLGPELR